jgi:putative transposase
MPRRKFECDSQTPYHLVARTNNRDWFEVPIEQVWRIMSDYLFFIHHAYSVKIHCFTLMKNHFHLVASFPEANLSSAMRYFLCETSKRIGRESGRINHLYGTRYFRSRLGSYHYFLNTYKYVYRNPVAAEEVSFVEEYKYSSLYGLLGRAQLTFPVEEDTLLFSNTNNTLNWMNSEPNLQHWDAMKKALKKNDFALQRCKTTKRRHPLETILM